MAKTRAALCDQEQIRASAMKGQLYAFNPTQETQLLLSSFCRPGSNAPPA